MARDLAHSGYEIHLFDEQPAGGGMMRSQIPSFHLQKVYWMRKLDIYLDLGIDPQLPPLCCSMKGGAEKATMPFLSAQALHADAI